MSEKKFTIRRIPLKGLNNTRDLGGLETTDGRKVKKHRLIRSGELAKATKSDIDTLKYEYKLKKIVDLRTDVEMERKPDPDIYEVDFEHVPFVDESTVGITREKSVVSSAVSMIKSMEQTPHEYMQGMYRALVSEKSSIENVKRFFEILLENEEGSVLFHCSAGKDRVGAATAILLSLLGVDRKTIIRDYLATQKFGEKYNKKYETLAAVLSKNKRVTEYAGVFLSTNKDFLLAFFAEIEEKYSSVSEYARICLGLDAEKQEKLKALYLE
ncbi:MAG: tyrosine-protein phosphatase [Clostridia bacterium]|nr:tyrosine-protein phosphatase [Clostridia bacterium]